MHADTETTVTTTATGARARRNRRRTAIRIGAVVVAAGAAMIAPIGRSTQAAPAPKPQQPEGVVCAPYERSAPAGQQTASFLLTATDGYISTPDGNSLYMWGFADGAGGYQHPGPTMCVNEGDVVSVTLHNSLKVPTSIQFSGIDGTTANGVEASPQFDIAGNLVALTNQALPGETITYQFTAAKPGTYLYQSGTDQQLQTQMGLFGALIVRPTLAVPTAKLPTNWSAAEKAAARYAYDDPSPAGNYSNDAVVNQSTIYSSEHEYLLMLSEIDPDLHGYVEQHKTMTFADYPAAYHARYFQINGRSFPDTIAPNGAGWLPTQPYGSMAHVEPYDPVKNPVPALLRYIGVGVTAYPFHPHSNHEVIIGQDARVLPMVPVGTDATSDPRPEKFSIVVTPGSTIDATFRWTNVEDYTPTNPVPVPKPSALNLTEGDLWNGTPYLGDSAVLNAGINGKTECGEYYHVAHSHDLTQATNYGATFGGMLTLIRVDPPSPNKCGNV